MGGIQHLNKKMARIFLVLTLFAICYKAIYVRTSLFYRTWFYYPKFGDVLNKNDIVMISGETVRLYVKNINQRLTFKTTDYKVASVNYSGRVAAKKAGLAYITVTNQKGKKMICRVRVIELNETKITLHLGETKRLNVRGCFFMERYHSKNKTIATVSVTGKVTAKKKGTTTICVKAKGRELTCQVTVQ